LPIRAFAFNLNIMESGVVVYLKADSYTEFDYEVIKGLTEAATAANVTLVVYSSSAYHDPPRTDLGTAGLFGFIAATRPIGIIANAWLPETREPNVKAFLNRFPDIPVYFLGEGYEGRPYAHLRGYDYLRELVDHLVRSHGRSKTAYVSSAAIDDRDAAYRDYMSERGLWDDRLYLTEAMIESTTTRGRVENAMRLLFDREGAPRPDAILSMSTDEAVAFMDALRQRGIAVPEDVAVAAWEDGEAGRCSEPPLTCVEYPYYALGRVGGQHFFARLRGETEAIESRVPTRAIYRRSCGCSHLAVAIARQRRGTEPTKGSNAAVLADLARLRTHLLDPADQANLDSRFLTGWETLVRRELAVDTDQTLHRALSAFRLEALSLPEHNDREKIAEKLEIAQSLLEDFGRADNVKNTMSLARIQQSLTLSGLSISNADTRAGVLEAVTWVTREIGIPGCWVFMPDGNLTVGRQIVSTEKPEELTYSLALWYGQGRRQADREGKTGRIDELLAEVVREAPTEGWYLGRILNNGESFQGLILFDTGPHDPRTLESLSRIVSASLTGALNRERLLEAQEETRFIAEHDHLTSLENRYAFYRKLDELCLAELPDAAQPPADAAFALLFIDLDGFKPINDSFGHDAGDYLLREVATRIKETVAGACVGIYRHGGDEFTVLARLSGAAETQALGERILAALSRPVTIGARTAQVTASVGCARFPVDAADPAELVKYADLSMYAAKETRASVVLFDRRKDSLRVKRLALATDILASLERGQIEVRYQGIFDDAGKRAGIEALVRWRHPVHGLLLPREFLDIANESNMIVPIETEVLNQACARARALAAESGGETPFMLVNFSATFFYSPDFLDIVSTAIEREGIRPETLRLALEERFALQDTQKSLAIVKRLEALGVRFAVDCMGVQSTWTRFLFDLPANTIVKIDRGFVAHIDTSDRDLAFLSRFIDLFEAHGLTVAISGIETDRHRELLRDRKCLFQGFALDDQ